MDGKTTKNSQRQRKLILEKAGELFWVKGYEGTSMKDIGRACGFQSPNIYTYFRSKEHLLYDVIKAETSRAYLSIKHLENDENTNPIDQLRALIESDIDCVLGRTTTSRLLYDIELKHLLPAHRKKIIKVRDNHDRVLGKVIRRGIAKGYFAQIDEKMVTYTITSIILRTRMWFSPKGRLSANEIADFIFRFALGGLISSNSNTEIFVNAFSKGSEEKST